jgi:hypothetical protein
MIGTTYWCIKPLGSGDQILRWADRQTFVWKSPLDPEKTSLGKIMLDPACMQGFIQILGA